LVDRDAGRVGQQVACRARFGRGISQAFAVHLLGVDALATLGAFARHRERFAHQRVGGRDQFLHPGQVDRPRIRVRHGGPS
jgi:hypothetical protein